MSDTAVLVFAKAPVAGLAKTRLAPALGPEGAARLAERLLERAVAAACEADLGPVRLCVTPTQAHPAFERLAGRFPITIDRQQGDDLGRRMHHALATALQEQPRALLIGTDAPALDAPMLRAADAALHHHEAVFVPALDGGYALVGLRTAAPGLFEGIAWSTPEVMAETRRRAAGLGLTLHELPPVADIDEPADLAHLPPGWP